MLKPYHRRFKNIHKFHSTANLWNKNVYLWNRTFYHYLFFYYNIVFFFNVSGVIKKWKILEDPLENNRSTGSLLTHLYEFHGKRLNKRRGKWISKGKRKEQACRNKAVYASRGKSWKKFWLLATRAFLNRPAGRLGAVLRNGGSTPYSSVLMCTYGIERSHPLFACDEMPLKGFEIFSFGRKERKERKRQWME